MWQICLCALYNATAETGLIAPLAPSPWQQRVARRGGRACCPACTFILWYVLLLQIGLAVTSGGTENGKSEWDGRRSWVC